MTIEKVDFPISLPEGNDLSVSNLPSGKLT